MTALRASNRLFILSLCVASVFVAYFAAKGVNYLLDPGTALPAKPSAADVAPEDLAKLEAKEPWVAMALEKPELPYFFVSAPVPDGTVVEFTMDAIPEYVTPIPDVLLRVLVTLNGGVGKTPRLAAPDHKPLPAGRYEITVRHRDAALVERAVFVGLEDDAYRSAVFEHQKKLRGWAADETREIDAVAARVERHLRANPKGALAKWAAMMTEVRAALDKTRLGHNPLMYERGYERLNRILRDADGVEKEKDRIAKLAKPDKERSRIAGLTTDVVLADLKKLREDAAVATRAQTDPEKVFERTGF